jgi:hypothetical protein
MFRTGTIPAANGHKMIFRLCGLLALLALLSIPTLAGDIPSDPAPQSLERGFRDLYNLKFAPAQQEFDAWKRANPADPVGPVSEGAGWLFSEFHRLGILEAQFYENDSAFQARRKNTPDPAVRQHFEDAIARAETLARSRLATDPRDRDALFAMTLAAGLKADYAALIDKRNLASLHFTKDATGWAQQLLAIDPNCYDAHIATGVSKYIIGTMAAPVRWLLRIGGISGDKQAGIAELQLTAERGHYLAPFARILLAIAYVREKDKPKALELLASLRSEFPENPLFAQEIARLDAAR